MIRPLHNEACTALTIKKGDLITPIEYGSGRTPTDKVQYAAFDTVEVVSVRFFRGTVEIRNDLHLSSTRTFKELGLPRFATSRFKLGFWRRRVCTVPKEVAHDMMRQYIDAHREPIKRGPGWGPFDLAAITKNQIGLDESAVLTPWDRDKIAS